LLKRFVDTVEPLLELIAANQDMSETLAEIRDTLLPKLLSGEVRVPLDQPAEVALP
jgi:type I restriction enzyme S subunit